MKLVSAIATLLNIFLVTQLTAQPACRNPSGNQETECQDKLLKSDPFDPVIAIPSGPYTGKKLNTKRKRPIKFLPRTDKIYGAYGAHLEKDLLVANFAHDTGEELRFWVAKIPLDAVESAYWVKNTFITQDKSSEVDAEILAHSQLRFNLSRPAELLVDQSELKTNESDFLELATKKIQPSIKLNSISSSLEAMFKFEDGEYQQKDKGQQYAQGGEVRLA